MISELLKYDLGAGFGIGQGVVGDEGDIGRETIRFKVAYFLLSSSSHLRRH